MVTLRRIRSLMVICGAPLALLSAAASGGFPEQQTAAANDCRATIVFTGSANQCPSAPMKFRIYVPGCKHSSGAFGYEYMVVNEAQKVAVSKTGTWTQGKREWEQTEHVPLACDDAILQVENVHIARCTCGGPQAP